MAHSYHKSVKYKGKITTAVTPKGKCINGTTKSKTKKLKKGESVSIDKMCSSNNAYHISTSKHAGWVPAATVNLDMKSTLTKMEAAGTADMRKRVKASVKSLKTLRSGNKLGYNSRVMNCLVNDPTGIHGMPYSFMDRTDWRLDVYSGEYGKPDVKVSNVNFGRKYVEKIASKMPLLLLTPGMPNFTPDMGKTDRNNIIAALASTLQSNKASSGLNNLLKSKNGRYYSFDFKYASYYKYVNAMLRYCAISLGIHNVKHTAGNYTQKLSSFKWQKAVNTKLKGFINSQEYVAFYIDSETSISESFGNVTNDSQLKGATDGISSQAKELAFLAGPIAGIKLDALDSEVDKAAFQDQIAEVQSLSRKYLKTSKLFDNIGEGLKTVAKGGHLIFPEIYDNSSFDRNYDISMKLRTPDGDKISWYLNICVPLIHLIAMTAPRSMGPNSFKSPFLVRAFYKGIFNVDLGIISNLNVTKGREGAWSVDGLPTEVDISLSIKELYSSMAISDTSITDKSLNWKFFKNTALVDYLSNMVGINVNKPDMERMVAIYSAFTKNAISDMWGGSWMNINNSMTNWMNNIYGKVKL